MALLISEMSIKIMERFFIYLMLLLRLVLAQTKDIPNYTLYEITAFNYRERAFLYWHHIKNDALVFMNGVTNQASQPMHVAVHECCVAPFDQILHQHNIQHVKIKTDFLRYELNERGNLNTFSEIKLNSTINPLHTFLTLNDIKSETDKFMMKYSSLSKYVIGITYEGRQLVVFKVSTSTVYKPAVFVMGGEEGRDWLSPMIIVNFISSLLQNPEKWRMLTNIYNLYFLPLTNPDGYHYSMTEDMLWFKNRRRFLQKSCPTPDFQDAIGVNIDRNWYQMPDKIQSRSHLARRKDECDSVFIGDNALSEQETISVSMFLNNIAVDLMGFICIKGFRNLITLPYSNSEEYANNHAIMMDIISAAIKNVEKEINVTFHYGNTGVYFYNYSGNSADWVKRNLNVPIVYSVYLKPEDYLIPRTEHIEPLGKQFMTIFNETMLFAHKIYGPLFNYQIRFNANIYMTTFCFILKYLN